MNVYCAMNLGPELFSLRSKESERRLGSVQHEHCRMRPVCYAEYCTLPFVMPIVEKALLYCYRNEQLEQSMSSGTKH